MKPIFSIFTVCIAFVITAPTSMGMGYPQDMFAEHITPKRVKKHLPPGKVSKIERMDAQKAACSPAGRRLNQQSGTRPCKGKNSSKQNKDKRQVSS